MIRQHQKNCRRPANHLRSTLPFEQPREVEALTTKARRARLLINTLAIARRAASSKATSEALEEDFASVTAVKSKKAIRKTITSVFREARGSKGLPPTPDKLKLLGGLLSWLSSCREQSG